MDLELAEGLRHRGGSKAWVCLRDSPGPRRERNSSSAAATHRSLEAAAR